MTPSQKRLLDLAAAAQAREPMSDAERAQALAELQRRVDDLFNQHPSPRLIRAGQPEPSGLGSLPL